MIPAALVGAGVVLAMMGKSGPKNTVDIRSMRDGKVYHVQNLPDKQEACEMMSKIQENIKKLLQNYKDDPASMADPRVNTMVTRFNPENMSENDIDDENTSYSENKGEKIVVCIRDKQKPYKIADENTVMFVILHEMAHLMTTTVGHTPEFWANFKRILHDAVQCGIYTPVNYARQPTSYCGMTITDSPI
jgi:predicted metal-dependent hydrolase